MNPIVPVILAGGSGTRLWPLSRHACPKPFLPLTEAKPMLQVTVARAAAVEGTVAPLVVCNEEHRFLVAEQLRSAGVKDATILLEPVGRNTAPAAAIAALAAEKRYDEPLLLVLPADHALGDTGRFSRCVADGAQAAADGLLVTFGIEPTSAETGYGYIQVGDRCEETGEVFHVAGFIEKPPAEEAERMIISGKHLWNSGMFLFRGDIYLSELENHAPAIAGAARQAERGGTADLDFIRLPEEQLASCPSDSIDCAVMERTQRAAVVPLHCSWSDVGSWDALHQSAPCDEAGNVVHGDVLLHGTRDSYIHADRRLVAAVGVDRHVIIETADAVLVAHRDHAQEVKALVERLQREGRAEADVHRRVFRPWGSYEGITEADRFQVKCITVDPGAGLSRQMHHHRAEHWIVVRGTARVECGEETYLVSEGESTYVPIGTTHRLENPGMIPLELIEVQTGSYLGEDDIVRFDDRYGRLHGRS